MNRSKAMLASRAAAFLACALLLTSCARQQPTTVAGRGVETPVTPADELPPIQIADVSEAILVLEPTAVVPDFMARHGLNAAETVDIEGTTYQLVTSTQYETSQELITALNDDGDTKYVYPNSPIDTPESGGQPMSFDDGYLYPNGGPYHTQAYVTKVRLAMAHQIARGFGVRVGVLDTGIHTTHPEFSGITIVPGFDFTIAPHGTNITDRRNLEDEDNNGFPDSGYGHGTHVAGIVHLVAPEATLVIERVLDDEGRGKVFGVVCGIADAMARGAVILNLSLGMDADHEVVHHAIQAARNQGVAVVCSAGNQGPGAPPQYPASYPEAFSIAAVNGSDVIWSYSNRNTAVDASAPGVDVISTFPPYFTWHGYCSGDGTSMAAPWVSGVAALVKSQYATTGWGAVDHAIKYAIPIDGLPSNKKFKGFIGRGRIDAYGPVFTGPDQL